MKNVTFRTHTTFLGRNGTFKAAGLDITLMGDHISLTPITSRGELARCEINIPFMDVWGVIAALEDITKDHYRVKLAADDTNSPNINGYLAWNGEICNYTRGNAIKKAKWYNGKIEKI